jgi:hypothetical protein
VLAPDGRCVAVPGVEGIAPGVFGVAVPGAAGVAGCCAAGGLVTGGVVAGGGVWAYAPVAKRAAKAAAVARIVIVFSSIRCWEDVGRVAPATLRTVNASWSCSFPRRAGRNEPGPSDVVASEVPGEMNDQRRHAAEQAVFECLRWVAAGHPSYPACEFRQAEDALAPAFDRPQLRSAVTGDAIEMVGSFYRVGAEGLFAPVAAPGRSPRERRFLLAAASLQDSSPENAAAQLARALERSDDRGAFYAFRRFVGRLLSSGFAFVSPPVLTVVSGGARDRTVRRQPPLLRLAASR